jgi:uncharacterized membrane protein YbaN (DUF454 family)
MTRHVWQGAGLLCLGLGAVGAFLPLLPTVPFLLLAALCFARGNPEWERRLLAHPRWGPPILDWRHRGAIGRRAKLAAFTALAASAILALALLSWPWVIVPLAACLISGTWIGTRPE